MAVERTAQGERAPAEGIGLVLTGLMVGALAALVALPLWGGGLARSLEGARAYWYISRATGLVAYALLWASVALGLLISSRVARVWPGGPQAVDLHQFTSLLALGFSLAHGAVLLGDTYLEAGPLPLLIPFALTAYRPLWVGLGQVSFYATAAVVASFYLRRRLGPRRWRLLHYTTFGIYWLVTAHGLLAGTDTSRPLVVALYGVTAAVVYGLTVYRLLVSAVPGPGRGSANGVKPAHHPPGGGR